MLGDVLGSVVRKIGKTAKVGAQAIGRSELALGAAAASTEAARWA